MLTFKQFLLESAGGNYVSIDLDTELPDFGLTKMYPNAKLCQFKDQHVTLVYSKETSVPLPKVQQYLDNSCPKFIHANVIECAAFDSIPKDGERDENLCTVVIKIKSPDLVVVHEGLKSLGLKHSYDEFSPHISLIYDFPRSDKDAALAHINKLIDGGTIVKLSGYKNDKIKTDWTSKL